jgi:hypothetical protein
LLVEETGLTIQQLIKEQRDRMNSGKPVERFATALLISGVLAERLNELHDPPMGQLLLNEVWSRLSLLSPESTICLQAVDRLRRSRSGDLTTENSAAEQQQRATCPICGYKEAIPTVKESPSE